MGTKHTYSLGFQFLWWWVFSYRIAGNFWGRTLSRFGGKLKVRRENFRGLLVLPYKWSLPTKFTEKTFADDSETVKHAKVFSLKSFPLYGMLPFCYYTYLTPCWRWRQHWQICKWQDQPELLETACSWWEPRGHLLRRWNWDESSETPAENEWER